MQFEMIMIALDDDPGAAARRRLPQRGEMRRAFSDVDRVAQQVIRNKDCRTAAHLVFDDAPDRP